MTTDTTSTQQATTSDTHPWWCARTKSCTPNSRFGDIHLSPPRTGTHRGRASDEEGRDGAVDFTAGLRVAAYTEAGEIFDRCARLTITNDEMEGHVELYIGSNVLRNFARWLTEMADYVDEVHAGGRPDVLDRAMSNTAS